jgi:hypothetical protein
MICLLLGPEPPLRGVVEGGLSPGREMLLPPLKDVPGGSEGPPEVLGTAVRPLGVTKNFMPAGTITEAHQGDVGDVLVNHGSARGRQQQWRK